MALRYEFSKSVATQTLVGQKKPSITGITRLETQPTAINLRQGLAAPLADPLWMLARQWQFNEFQGEDAGTPLRLSFRIEGVKVDAFRAGPKADAPWQPIGEHDVPIETRVEAEPAWMTHPRLRGEAGMHALRMANPTVRAALLAGYRLDLPQPTDPDADRAGMLWSRLLDSRTIDAIKLANELRPLRNPDSSLNGLPARLALAGADADDARTMLAKWLAWLDDMLYEGDTAQTSWQRNRMEYAFALKAGDTRLESAEYTDAHVDWEDFQAHATPADPPVPQTFAVASRHPTPVRYPGMPAERFWEFEDGDVNFAGAEAGVTDLLRMSVTEFALTFGNDWFLTPVRLPVGWLHRVAEFTITDSFGLVTQVGPIQNPGNALWTLYSMTAAPELQGRLQHTMFLPDSLEAVEGAVLEETTLVRDEMANLAWAIEHTVQGVSGEPLDRQLEAHALAFQQRIAFDGGLDTPQLVYRLQTPVPANWIPLLPVRDEPLDFADPLTIRLARAGMKRFYPEASVQVLGNADPQYTAFLDLLDAQDTFITAVPIDPGLRSYVFYPRGWILRRDPTEPMADDDTLLIEEEEVPRIGAIVRRKFQYARSCDGRTWLWMGRSKVAGRGEANSALRYDVAVKRETLR
ncbi:MAG TPA: hypothetical protein VKB34_14170 [Povalibacter sp.]|nr:hypothetical protein [Povalibacter sp.]